jgi:hypothetical protein
MPRRNITVTDKTAFLEQLENEPPNTSYCQLAEVTRAQNLQLHTLYVSKRNCEMSGCYAMDKSEKTFDWHHHQQCKD